LNQALGQNWPELRKALITQFKTQTPFEERRRLYNTQFNGSVHKFIEELEAKCCIITNKLALENIEVNNYIYINAMKNTVKNVIIKNSQTDSRCN